MSELSLHYEQDDEPNACGFLTTRVSADGFEAWNRTYVAENWLTAFARQVGAYPIPDSGVSFAEAPDISIVVTPLNWRGHLRVSVSLIHGYDQSAVQSASIQVISDYAAIATFCQELLAINVGATNKATLRAHA